MPLSAGNVGALSNRIRVKEPAGISGDNVRTPADPDSIYNAHLGQGYLAKVMEIYKEVDDSAAPPRARQRCMRTKTGGAA